MRLRCFLSLLILTGLVAACGGSGGDDCGGACETPPADACTADGELLQYEAVGACIDGECLYASESVVCEVRGNPCVRARGVCVGDPQAHCEHEPLPDGSDCSNGLYCDGAETCLDGQCVAGMGVQCEDTNNPCTLSLCSEETEQCEIENLADGTVCDDGDACTEGDSCLAGVCAPGRDICAEQSVALMFYMAADNDLDDYMEMDWHELEVANVDDFDWLRVFVLIDQSRYAARSDTRLYEIHNGGSSELDGPMLGLTVSGTEELNMADAANVTAFIADVKAIMADTPNVSYFLMMNDHGDGWWKKSPLRPESGALTRGCCYDDDDPGGFISNADLHAAISGQGLSLIGFDACLQGMAEVAYELRQDAEVMVASQEMEGAWGWAYTALVSQFGASADPSPENFGRLAVDTYLDLCAQQGDPTGTLAVTDLAQVDALAAAAGPVATALKGLGESAYWDLCGELVWYGCDGGYCEEYTDLWTLMAEAAGVDPAHASAYQALQTAVENAVIYEGHGSAHAEAHGLNVFYACEHYPYEEYSDISWAIDTGWGDMVNSH